MKCAGLPDFRKPCFFGYHPNIMQIVLISTSFSDKIDNIENLEDP
jgi:hypothetical protein